MTIEVHGLRDFYASAGGALAARLVRERLAALWPALPGLSVLGLGHAAPYLGLWRAEARACIALTPSAALPVELLRWPDAPAASATLVAEEEALPFADASFDRVLLVHALEGAGRARRLLREVWRVLRDDGRLIVVVPNRTGLWAHLDRTPFGHGQPYSAGQLERLLARHLFRAERRESALFVPPYGLRFLGTAATGWERLGRRLCPRLAGLAMVEAEKDLFSAMPAGAVSVTRRVLAPLRAGVAASTADQPSHASLPRCRPMPPPA
jgi:SAM-dependent methyltransferase